VTGRRRYDRLDRLEEAISVRRPEVGAARRRSHSFLQGLTVLGIAVALSAFLVSLGLFTATRPATAVRIIARAVPAMTEEDALLVIHGADLQAEAKADLTKAVSLPGFPVTVSLPARTVATSSPQQLELLLANRAAVVIYHDGLRAFSLSGTPGAVVTGPLLSPTWTMHQGLTFLSARSHSRYGQIALILGLLLLALIVVFCLQAGAYARLLGVGMAGVGAALAAGLLTLFVWLITQLNYSSSGSPLGTAAWGIMADMTWTMVLVDLIALVCAIVLLAAGYVLARLDRAPSPASSPVTPPTTSYEPPLDRLRRNSLNRVPRRSSPPN
jgi:hypothetical protein